MNKKTIYPFLLSIHLAVAASVPFAQAAEPPVAPPLPGVLAAMNADRVEKQEFPWGWITWLMDSKIDKQATMTFGIVQIDAGKENPLHLHPNCEEYLYVLSGSCEHVIGTKTIVLKPGDMIRIPKDVRHKAKSLGKEPCKAVIVYNAAERQVKMLDEGGKE